jgi:hypothetical protein
LWLIVTIPLSIALAMTVAVFVERFLAFPTRSSMPSDRYAIKQGATFL